MNVNDLNVISIIIFAMLIFVGGIIGYVKRKSKASLIAGIVSTIILVWCAKTTHHHPNTGIMRTFMLIALLEGIFVVRLIKTRKFMPAGMILILCVLEQIFLLWNYSHL